jgi:hypothetical protein
VNYNNSAGNVQLQVVNTPGTTADNWNGGTGNWSTGSGWSSGASPTFYSDVGIGLTATGNVTLDQDGTINSLAIHNGNTLQYQATTAKTLTVGTNVTIDSGGALNMTTSGNKLAVGGTVGNTGIVTVGGGTSLNVVNLGNAANAVLNQSGGQIQLGGSLTSQGAVANNSGATLTMQGGSLAAPSFANAGTTSGFGTIVPAIANTGLVQASGGTLTAQNGIQGTTGNITVNPAATLDLSQSTTGSSAAALAVNGNLSLGGQNLTVATSYNNANFGTGNTFNKTANVTGPGLIQAAGNVAQAVSGSQVTNGTSATPTLTLGNVHVGSSTSANYSVANTGTSGPSLLGAIQTNVNGGNITNSALSGSGMTAQNFGPIATGASTSPFTVTYAPTAAGALSGQAVHVANNFGNVSEQTMSITGAAYNLASSNTIAPINFGVLHVGDPTATQALSITNTAPVGAFSEGLDSGFGSYNNNGGTLTPGFAGAITNLAAGSTNSSSMLASLSTATAGSVDGTVTIHQASNGTISGLSNTALADQTPAVTGTVQATITNLAVPQVDNTQPIAFGNVRIGTAVATQGLSVTNAAPGGAFSEGLIGAANGASNAQITSSGGFGAPGASLAPQATNTGGVQVGINTNVAGAISGNALIDFKSDGTGFSGGTVTDLGNTNVAVTGAVFRLATGSAASPFDIGAARLGIGTLSGNLSVTNTAANDGFSEKLNAGISATAPQVIASSGSVNGLAPGQTNSTGLSVALDNASAGTKSGAVTVQFQSDGTGIDGGAPINNGSQVVTVNGKVYTPVVANVVTSSPIDFGIVHVGDPTQTKSVTVQNAATATVLNDVLVGSISASGAPFSGSGNLGTGLGAQASSSALQVDLGTGTAGQFTGTANLALASHDADLADLALTTNPLSLKAQVNFYAALAFLKQGGQGSLTGGGTSFDLDFGSVLQGSSPQQALLAFLNDNPLAAQAFTDLLSSTGSVQSGFGFTITGDSVSNLAGGVISSPPFDVTFDTSVLGNFTEVLSFDVESINPNFDGFLGLVTLTLEGDVVSSGPSVAEPGTMTVLASGLGMVFFAVRRRRRMQ